MTTKQKEKNEITNRLHQTESVLRRLLTDLSTVWMSVREIEDTFKSHRGELHDGPIYDGVTTKTGMADNDWDQPVPQI